MMQEDYERRRRQIAEGTPNERRATVVGSDLLDERFNVLEAVLRIGMFLPILFGALIIEQLLPHD
jgi:hypothetical protein